MPIEVKELIVRAWVGTVAEVKKQEAKAVSKRGSEATDLQAEMLEQLKRMLTDRKDR
jgi:hypothetical protein